MSSTTTLRYSWILHALENLSSVRYRMFFPHLSLIVLGKDIEIALTEIRELQNALDDLKMEEESKKEAIRNLSEENYRLSE